jgi:hypothetical protein
VQSLERVNQPAITLVFIKLIYRQIQINYRALTSFYLAFNNAMAETKVLDIRAQIILKRITASKY